MPNIKPVSDLRNYTEILRMADIKFSPEAITDLQQTKAYTAFWSVAIIRRFPESKIRP